MTPSGCSKPPVSMFRMSFDPGPPCIPHITPFHWVQCHWAIDMWGPLLVYNERKGPYIAKLLSEFSSRLLLNHSSPLIAILKQAANSHASPPWLWMWPVWGTVYTAIYNTRDSSRAGIMQENNLLEKNHFYQLGGRAGSIFSLAVCEVWPFILPK